MVGFLVGAVHVCPAMNMRVHSTLFRSVSWLSDCTSCSTVDLTSFASPLLRTYTSLPCPQEQRAYRTSQVSDLVVKTRQAEAATFRRNVG